MSVIQARFRLIILLLVVGFVLLFAVLIVEAQVYECRTASICAVMKKQVPVHQLCRGLAPLDVAVGANLDFPGMLKRGTWDRFASECMDIRRIQ